jgi:SagB-type dehydrogenase family enzyme
MNLNEAIKNGRKFLKSHHDEIEETFQSDQNKKIPQPALEKEYDKNKEIIELTPEEEFDFDEINLKDLIKNRKSHRTFIDKPLSLKELSFLLWSTQGTKEIIKNNYAALKTVPSAGARHPFETYLYIRNVENLEQGLYRYLSLEHKLLKIETGNFDEQMLEAALGQRMVIKSAVDFIWTVTPYRTEWRYSILSHKVIALDAGHICQNLYLSSELINAGTCAIGAYSQTKSDELLKLDGKEEFTIYMAPVGKIK